MDSFISCNDTSSLGTDLPNYLFDECNLFVSSNFLQMVHSFYELVHNSQSLRYSEYRKSILSISPHLFGYFSTILILHLITKAAAHCVP